MEHNKNLTLKYSNGEVTVVWQPHKCQHSTKCWRELPSVFKPWEKPWVKINGASTKVIVEQVKLCPSGALSFYMNDEKNNLQTHK